VLTEYRGLTVMQQGELRSSLRRQATFAIVKNTLTDLAQTGGDRSITVSAPHVIAQLSLSTSSWMDEVTAEFPMLAFTLTRKRRRMIIGSASGWLTSAGMIAWPAATSDRTSSTSHPLRTATDSVSGVTTLTSVVHVGHRTAGDRPAQVTLVTPPLPRSDTSAHGGATVVEQLRPTPGKCLGILPFLDPALARPRQADLRVAAGAGGGVRVEGLAVGRLDPAGGAP